MAQQTQQPENEPQAPKTPETTQKDLAQDSGDGIRGGYGDSDQTNGLEGGGQADKSDQKTPPTEPAS
jgi:hypothetical protein